MVIGSSSSEYIQKTASKLYYYGARYYDPRTSVWIGIDPMSDKYPGWSPFAYCHNNPIRLIDPNGMETVDLGEGEQKKTNQPSKLKVPYALPNNPPSQNPWLPPPKQPNNQPANSPQKNHDNNSNKPASTVSSPRNSMAVGQSFDITIAIVAIGYTIEAGYVADSKGNANLFLTYGPAFGIEASISENLILIPSRDFEVKDFEGSGTSLTGNAGIFGFGAFGNNRSGYPTDKWPATYWGFKTCIGAGVGSSYQHTTTKLFTLPRMRYYQSRQIR